jgi:hypothetical protein
MTESGTVHSPRIRFVGGVVVLVLAVLLSATASGVRGEEDTPRISAFILGKASPRGCPFVGYFGEDPLFTYSLEPIPADLPNKEKRKIDRLYYPRTRKILIESYDFITFADARIQHFTGRQLADLDYAFREAGMVSFSSFGPSWIYAFEPTTLYDTLPISDYDFYFPGNWRVDFHTEREPIFTPFIELGVEKVMGNYYAYMKPRDGTTIWADMAPLDLPWLVSWRPGGRNAGIQWACADEFNSQWWALTAEARGSNPYAIDLVTNLILYSLDRPLINDIHARREARRLLSTFQAQKLLVLSMMEWADHFGASVLSLSTRLTDPEREVANATDSYLEQEYNAAVSVMQTMSPRVTEITGDAVDMKNEAMLWVFISEWMAVTSTGMVAGAVVWSLMVRRRMYRAAGITRLRMAHGDRDDR